MSATLLHNDVALTFEYRGHTPAIVIPAEKTTKLVDVVKVQWR